MNSYFGTITIIKISNGQLANSSGNKDDYAFIPFGESNIRFEHYPDCQQLIVWLPHPGSEYGKLRLVNNKSKLIEEEWPVTDRVNGSIQIILDTLPIAPGLYTIEIDWKNGWQHQIYFEKHNNGEAATGVDRSGSWGKSSGSRAWSGAGAHAEQETWSDELDGARFAVVALGPRGLFCGV